MKTALTIITAILLLSGCITEKKRAKICSTCPSLITFKDSIREVITNRDTTIYITRSGDSIYIPCDSLKYKKVFKRNGLKLTVTKDIKGIEANCEADSLKAVITGLNKEITRVTKESETKTIIAHCALKHQSGFDKFCQYVFWFDCVLLIILVLIFYLKSKI